MTVRKLTKVKCKYCGKSIKKDQGIFFFRRVCEDCYVQRLSEQEFINMIEVVL